MFFQPILNEQTPTQYFLNHHCIYPVIFHLYCYFRVLSDTILTNLAETLFQKNHLKSCNRNGREWVGASEKLLIILINNTKVF